MVEMLHSDKISLNDKILFLFKASIQALKRNKFLANIYTSRKVI